MLVLTRRFNEQITIGNDIVVTVVAINGDRVRIGIDAPKDVPVFRKELLHRVVTEIPCLHSNGRLLLTCGRAVHQRLSFGGDADGRG